MITQEAAVRAAMGGDMLASLEDRDVCADDIWNGLDELRGHRTNSLIRLLILAIRTQDKNSPGNVVIVGNIGLVGDQVMKLWNARIAAEKMQDLKPDIAPVSLQMRRHRKMCRDIQDRGRVNPDPIAAPEHAGPNVVNTGHRTSLSNE